MAIFLIITEAIDDVYANTCLFTYHFGFLASIDVYIYIYIIRNPMHELSRYYY